MVFCENNRASVTAELIDEAFTWEVQSEDIDTWFITNVRSW